LQESHEIESVAWAEKLSASWIAQQTPTSGLSCKCWTVLQDEWQKRINVTSIDQLLDGGYIAA